jgi:hypothetical protein
MSDDSRSSSEPLGQQTNCIRWMQKQVMRKAAALPASFNSRREWESFRDRIRTELPRVIGLPQLPKLGASRVRGRVNLGADVIVERVDVHMDDDYSSAPGSGCRPCCGTPAGRRTSSSPPISSSQFAWRATGSSRW